MAARTTLLQRISDGFLPTPVANWLYTPWVRIGPTDVNGWTGVHFVMGMVFGFLPVADAFVLHALWEAFQFLAGDNKRDIETLIDITLDTTAFMLGHYVAVNS